MKKLIYIIILMLISSSFIYSQVSNSSQTDKKTPASDSKSEGGSAPVGFGDLAWQTSLKEARKMVTGEIVYTDGKRTIDTKDGDISYHYGFFYVEPDNGETETEMTGADTSGEENSDTKLFYVTVKFPYLVMEDVRKKLEEKYGRATGQTLKNHQGAVIWDYEKTMIVMWVYRYEGKPFCSKINYIGKELSKEINNYQQRVFNKREIEILKNLSL